MTALWLQNLATASLQITLLVVAGGLLPYCLGLRAAKARLVYWQVLLALCVLLPALEPRKAAPVPASEVTITQTALAVRQASPTRSLPPLGDAVAFALLAGVAARGVWLALGFWRLRRYRLSARLLSPVPEPIEVLERRIGARARLYLSPDITGPVTFGLLRPVILFPARYFEMDPQLQQAIACHELLHVRRGDWAFTVAEELVRTVLWFHPAVWWLLGRIQLTREQVVDREVVDLFTARDRYLDALLAMAEAKVRLDLAPAPLFLRQRHLRQRVASILKEVTMSRRQLAASLLSALGALALAARLAVWTFPLAAPAQEERFVTVDSGGLTLMHRGTIAYPHEALEKNIQGAVVLEVGVNQKGLVYDAHVLSGPDELRRAALESVLQWHYATNSPLPAKAQVTVNFQLPPKPTTEGRIVARGPYTSRVEPVIQQPDLGVLKQIEVRGLSNEARDALVSKLPVHVGDQITQEARERINQIVWDADEHLLVSYQRQPEGGTTLYIFLRNTPPPFAPAARVTQILTAPAAARVAGGAVGGVIGGIISSAPVTPAPAAAEAGPQRIRVGSSAARANLIESKAPQYPPLAKQARIQGTVSLEVLVGRDGHVQNITVISGHPLLIPPSIEAVKEWVYRPTLLNGDAVEVITQVDVNFTLSE